MRTIQSRTIQPRTIQHWIAGSETTGASTRWGPVWNPATGEQQAAVVLAERKRHLDEMDVLSPNRIGKQLGDENRQGDRHRTSATIGSGTCQRRFPHSYAIVGVLKKRKYVIILDE